MVKRQTQVAERRFGPAVPAEFNPCAALHGESQTDRQTAKLTQPVQLESGLIIRLGDRASDDNRCYCTAQLVDINGA